MKEIPKDHPLRSLFRRATRGAFRFRPELYTENISLYFSERVLARFVHVDSIFLIRNSRGRKLAEAAGMLAEGVPPEGSRTPVDELALTQHVGDYVLFMAGVFPENLTDKGAPDEPEELLVKVGSLFRPCSSPLDYYLLGGQAFYRRASRLMRRFSAEWAEVLKRLSKEFPGYVNVMSLIKLNLEGSAYFSEIKGIIGEST